MDFDGNRKRMWSRSYFSRYALFCVANQSHNWFISKFTSLSWMRLCSIRISVHRSKNHFLPKQIRTLFLSLRFFLFIYLTSLTVAQKQINWLGKYLEKCGGWNLYTVTNVYVFNRKSRFFACVLFVYVCKQSFTLWPDNSHQK